MFGPFWRADVELLLVRAGQRGTRRL